jgi:hypothetical protein
MTESLKTLLAKSSSNGLIRAPPFMAGINIRHVRDYRSMIQPCQESDKENMRPDPADA